MKNLAFSILLTSVAWAGDWDDNYDHHRHNDDYHHDDHRGEELALRIHGFREHCAHEIAYAIRDLDQEASSYGYELKLDNVHWDFDRDRDRMHFELRVGGNERREWALRRLDSLSWYCSDVTFDHAGGDYISPEFGNLLQNDLGYDYDVRANPRHDWNTTSVDIIRKRGIDARVAIYDETEGREVYSVILRDYTNAYRHHSRSFFRLFREAREPRPAIQLVFNRHRRDVIDFYDGEVWRPSGAHLINMPVELFDDNDLHGYDIEGLNRNHRYIIRTTYLRD